MLLYFFVFLLLALVLSAGAVAAGVVAALPHSLLAHAEEAGRYARLGSEAPASSGRPTAGRRRRAPVRLEACHG